MSYMYIFVELSVAGHFTCICIIYIYTPKLYFYNTRYYYCTSALLVTKQHVFLDDFSVTFDISKGLGTFFNVSISKHNALVAVTW